MYTARLAPSRVASTCTDARVDACAACIAGPSHRGAGSCDENVCDADLGQWQAYEEMYAKGKARAIGVSNYCQSCFKCLLNSANVTPAVNQSESR